MGKFIGDGDSMSEPLLMRNGIFMNGDRARVEGVVVEAVLLAGVLLLGEVRNSGTPCGDMNMADGAPLASVYMNGKVGQKKLLPLVPLVASAVLFSASMLCVDRFLSSCGMCDSLCSTSVMLSLLSSVDL